VERIDDDIAVYLSICSGILIIERLTESVKEFQPRSRHGTKPLPLRARLNGLDGRKCYQSLGIRRQVCWQ
jgi:hypothetical protein